MGNKRNKWLAAPGWHDQKLNPVPDKCPECKKPLISLQKNKGRVFSCFAPCGWKFECVFYFRSALEVRYARELQMREKAGEITGWEYEPETWDFNDRVKFPFRRHSQFKPDFKIWTVSGCSYTEVTGAPYGGKMTKIRRAARLFPERRLLIYTEGGSYLAPDYVRMVADQMRKKREIRKLKERSK